MWNQFRLFFDTDAYLNVSVISSWHLSFTFCENSFGLTKVDFLQQPRWFHRLWLQIMMTVTMTMLARVLMFAFVVMLSTDGLNRHLHYNSYQICEGKGMHNFNVSKHINSIFIYVTVSIMTVKNKQRQKPFAKHLFNYKRTHWVRFYNKSITIFLLFLIDENIFFSISLLTYVLA